MSNLKQSGLKKTESRLAIHSLLEENQMPMDAISILDSLKKSGLPTDLATVYRVLNAFYEKGIISRIYMGEGKYRYELQREHHHHLICTNCGEIGDVKGEFVKNIEKRIREQNGFLVKSHSLEFFGVCRKCQQ